jgi:hypothetical protein
MLPPTKGSIARNERGELGIIVDIFGGISVGFAVPVCRKRWTAHRPEVLGTVQEWINSRQPLDEWAKRKAT